MASPLHANQVPIDGVHTPISWVFASSVARLNFLPTEGFPLTSGSLTSVDLYKFAIQADDASLWLLTQVTPPAWQPVGSTTGISSSFITVNSETSLPNERVLSASFGLLISDGGPNSTISIQVNDNDVASLSGSIFRGPLSASAGLSGSLQRVGPGLSYLVAGNNVTIVTNSVGQVIVSALTSSLTHDNAASYLVLNATGSLANERVFSVSGSPGLTMSDGGSGNSMTLGLNDNVVAMISGSTFTGLVSASQLSTTYLTSSFSTNNISYTNVPASGTLIKTSHHARANPAWRSSVSGSSEIQFQPAFFDRRVMYVAPSQGASIPTALGVSMLTTGTISHPTPVSTSPQPISSMYRTRFTSNATTNSSAGLRTPVLSMWRGNVDGAGGFYVNIKFFQETNVSGSFAIVGLAALSAFTPNNPSIIPNLICMGYESSDSSSGNWSLFVNDDVPPGHKIDLGTNAARNTTDVFQLIIYAAPNSNSISVKVINRSLNVDVFERHISSRLPVSTAFMAIYCGCNNDSVASQVSIGFTSIYGEIEN